MSAFKTKFEKDFRQVVEHKTHKEYDEFISVTYIQETGTKSYYIKYQVGPNDFIHANIHEISDSPAKQPNVFKRNKDMERIDSDRKLKHVCKYVEIGKKLNDEIKIKTSKTSGTSEKKVVKKTNKK